MPRLDRAEVRRRLLDAAVEVFADRGFAVSTLDEVAAAAGFTKGAVYSNFAGKDELFYALMDAQISARVEMVQRLIGSATGLGLHDALRLAGTTLAEASVEQRRWQLLFVEFWSRAVRDERVRREFIAHRRTLRAAIATGISDAFPAIEGVMHLTIDEITTVVLALSNGFAIERLVDPDTISANLFGDVLANLAGGEPSVPRRPHS